MQLAVSNSYIMITLVFVHVSTVNYLLRGGGFSVNCTLRLCNRESFPVNNKNGMQPRKFSTANDLHYTVINSVSAHAMGANHA